MIAFLDAGALIYLMDGEAPWAQSTQATLQRLAAEVPDLTLAVSRLSVLECRVAPLRRGDQASLDRLLSSTQSGKELSESSLLEERTLVRFRRTSNGELMCQIPEGCWNAAVEQVDWNKIDATSDAEIERQEIADLVEVALQRQAGGLVALAERLHVSPSSVRRWRQARVMPSLVHRQRLHHLLKAQ